MWGAGGGGGVEWWMGLPVRSLARGAHLFGRGGPPTGLPCGSQIPTYSSFGVRPPSAWGGTSITMCQPAVSVRGHAGGRGAAGLAFAPAPFLFGGGRGSKRSAPLFPGPQGELAHGLLPRFVVAEIWADRGQSRGGGVEAPDTQLSYVPGTHAYGHNHHQVRMLP